MSQPIDEKLWDRILAIFEDKLQYGFIHEARALSRVELEGDRLTLFVTSDESERFFRAEVNQQRLIIMSRPVLPIRYVTVERI